MLAAGCSPEAGTAGLLASAQRRQQAGDIPGAVIDLKNVLQRLPGQAGARLRLGDIYLDSGDVLSAEKEFRRARDAGAAPAAVLPRLAQALLLQQRYEQVLTELPDDAALEGAALADVRTLRAYALLGLRRGIDAARLFNEVAATAPDHAMAQLGLARMALQAGAAEQAAGLVDAVLARNAADTEALRLRGDLFRRAGKPAEALDCYRKVIHLRPGNLLARLDAATVLAALGNMADANTELAAAARLAPSSPAVIYTQALLAAQQDNLPAALERVQLILKSAPDHAPSNLLAANLYFAQDRLPQAAQHVQRFLASQPGNVAGAKLAAAIAMREGRPHDAVALLEPLLDQYSGDADLQAAAGEAYMRVQAYARASACFDKAAALAPPGAALHTSQAVTQLGLGDNERAVSALELALQARGGADSIRQRAGALLVVAHLRAGAYDQALDAVHALERQHDNPALQNLKGGVLLARKDPDGARRAFDAALALLPGYLPALHNLAQLDRLAGRPAQARQRFEAALARDPNNTELMVALAALAADQGNAQAAQGWLERAHRAAPDALAPALQLAALYLETGAHARALGLAQKLQAAHPASDDALALLARCRAAAGDPEGALESYVDLASRRPDNVAVLVQLAGAHMALDRPRDALGPLRKALTLAPDHGPALAAAVRLLADLREWDQAMSLARAAQARSASATLGRQLEGDVAMARGQAAQALPLYRRAFDDAPSGPLAIALHRALDATGQRVEAARHIGRWLDGHPGDVPTRLYLASTLLAGGDARAAIPHYEQVLAAQPRHVVALNDLAWSYQSAGDARALSLAEQAHALAPDNPAVADTLGWILDRRGHSQRAVAVLKKAAETAPRAGDIRLHYAGALAHAGQRAEARRQLERLQADAGYARQDEVRALLAAL